MALEPGQVYAVMRAAYRQGVLDEFAPLLGEALDRAMEETGSDLNDLFNQMDEAQENTVKKLDKTISSSGFFMRIAGSDRLMRLCARLVEKERSKRVIVNVMRDFFVAKIDPEKYRQVPVGRRFRGYLASFIGSNGRRAGVGIQGDGNGKAS